MFICNFTVEKKKLFSTENIMKDYNRNVMIIVMKASEVMGKASAEIRPCDLGLAHEKSKFQFIY